MNVEPDLGTRGMSYARLSGYLPFDLPVQWTDGGRYAEETLRNMPQGLVGVYLRGRSVRPLSEDDYADLIARGFKETLDVRNAERLGVASAVISEAAEAIQQPAPAGERDRRIASILTNRIIRDASFSNAVYSAYDNRCAATGVRIIDSKGNSEVHAAHIWAVADGGPDVVQNGLALSATVHWLFDRYLMTIADDYQLIFAANSIPNEILALLNRNDGKIYLPTRIQDWPHPMYLTKHRIQFAAVNGLKH